VAARLFMLDPPLKIGRSEIADNDALGAMLAAGASRFRGFDPRHESNRPVGWVGPQVALVTTYASQPIVSEMKGTATGFHSFAPWTLKTRHSSVDKPIQFRRIRASLTTKLNSPDIDPNDRKTKGPADDRRRGQLHTGKENSQGRFVVIGSSAWAANSFLNFNGNRDLA